MVKWHNSGIVNNNIDPSPQMWNVSMAIFTLYMYSIRKVIMYNCHLDTQPGDLGPFKGCYSVTSTERSFSPRSKKRLETSKHPLNGGSASSFLNWLESVEEWSKKWDKPSHQKSNKSDIARDIDDRNEDESQINWGERDVIRLRNWTEDKRAFRWMLTSAEQSCNLQRSTIYRLFIGYVTRKFKC